MQLLPDDERGLQRALTLARDAAAFASPNPTVGCVLMRDGQILGEGAHIYDNRDHAEIVALKQAASLGHSPHRATACVTLEPCSHQGRTGPCADRLVAVGIGRCVVATMDPNPLVRGQGLAKLQRAGIEVVVADPASRIGEDARRLNDAFAFSIQHCRPFVTLKAAISRDGFLAPRQRERVAPHWLTGRAARADVQSLRHASDAIVTGIGTVLADNPSLTDRTGLPRRRSLLRVILDSQLRLPPEAAMLQGVESDVLIAASPLASEDREAALRACGAAVLRVPLATDGKHLDLHAVLQALHQRNIRSVLLEAGSALNAAFLEADLVDRVVLYRSQSVLGEGAIPFAAEYVSAETLEERLTAATRASFPHDDDSDQDDTRVIGYLHDPWQPVL
ncbi:MAG TPA: bifunctional diaminohydroxyphosphoribosylaminopyrimidine deaminase/5-amino-6-(5-phosphoribosylamino)uracil reductase RibD [Acidobacteriaceae bacterium]|jgi:diaminohydroxyphosphoribosylaminopyrimidine deaminase/5-amino-6-(5-phosphoribosylamino)uracil reductase